MTAHSNFVPLAAYARKTKQNEISRFVLRQIGTRHLSVGCVSAFAPLNSHSNLGERTLWTGNTMKTVSQFRFFGIHSPVERSFCNRWPIEAIVDFADFLRKQFLRRLQQLNKRQRYSRRTSWRQKMIAYMQTQLQLISTTSVSVFGGSLRR